jgi:N-acetylglucosaminyldiphosphoundecaprenol N-acetyl-beta-D-mannosaminyltransferase
MDNLPTVDVLGTPLVLTDYAQLSAWCLEWASQPKCVALDFANTQIVTMRRHEPQFRELTSAYDYFPPDGMPLVWCLNRAGASLRDRVYGPIFMERFFTNAPSGSTHFLLGGSEECGRQLKEHFISSNANIKFVGSFHGKSASNGILEGRADEDVIGQLNDLSPDFIWVGLGTPKQQAWVKHHKHLIRRGVILTVGFAFDVNAGMKADAPLWMQRLGLTWVFRLASEPRRLISRYLRYNSLFLWYLIIDGLRGRAWQRLYPSYSKSAHPNISPGSNSGNSISH